MVSDLTQVERHERAVGVCTHAEGSARVQHEQGGTIRSDPTENLDRRSRSRQPVRGNAHHDPAGRLSSTSHHSFSIFIALLLVVRAVVVIAPRRLTCWSAGRTCERHLLGPAPGIAAAASTYAADRPRSGRCGSISSLRCRRRAVPAPLPHSQAVRIASIWASSFAWS